MNTPTKQRRRTVAADARRAGAAITLPHWSPKQALAVFECIELIRDALWLEHGPDIQRAWRNELVRQPVSPTEDTDTLF